jgi:hypothetical protein
VAAVVKNDFSLHLSLPLVPLFAKTFAGRFVSNRSGDFFA